MHCSMRNSPNLEKLGNRCSSWDSDASWSTNTWYSGYFSVSSYIVNEHSLRRSMALQVHIRGEIIHQLKSVIWGTPKTRSYKILFNPRAASKNLRHAADHLPLLQVTTSMILGRREVKRGGGWRRRERWQWQHYVTLPPSGEYFKMWQ